jgi:hypothetical protein
VKWYQAVKRADGVINIRQTHCNVSLYILHLFFKNNYCVKEIGTNFNIKLSLCLIKHHTIDMGEWGCAACSLMLITQMEVSG